MASKRNALSSLIHGIDPRLYIGFHFLPTYEDGITIVEIKNAGEGLLPIFKEDDDLFKRPPEELKECYCFTKLESLGTNKVNRKLRDGSDRFWKNIHKEDVVVNNIFIGCVTKLRFHEDKNTPTEWHILEYRDRKTVVDRKTAEDAPRYVLCRIYKIEKKIDSAKKPHVASDIGAGRISSSTSQVSSMNQDQIHGVAQDGYPLPGDVINNPRQFDPSTSLDSRMWASGAREDMNQGQPDWIFNAATYPHVTGEHMNQDQIPGVCQYQYPGDVVNNPRQFPSCTYSNGGIDTSSGFDPVDWINGYSNGDLDPSDFDMDL